MNDAFIEMIANKYEKAGDSATARIIKCAYHLGWSDAGGKFEIKEEIPQELKDTYYNDGRT